MSNGSLNFRSVAPALGAEVRGLNLARSLSPDELLTVKMALSRHLVLFFRDQELTEESQLSLTRQFGEAMVLPYIGALPKHPQIIAVLKEADEAKISVFGGDWHSDFSFLPAPPMGSILSAREVPPVGGDTLWSSTIAAYDRLSTGLKTFLRGKRVMHSGHVYGAANPPHLSMATSKSIAISRNNPEADQELSHPVVRLHRSSGRAALFVNRIYTTRFGGMTVAESQPLLDSLHEAAIRPELTCRWSWRPGDVAIWDNRATLHYAINDYDGHRRLLHRTAIAGEEPIEYCG